MESTKLKKFIHRRHVPVPRKKDRESLFADTIYDATYEQDGITFTVFYTDGASRGNPGLSSIGVYVPSDEKRSVGELIPSTTCNSAEYKAFQRAFDIADEMGLKHVEIRSDSKLVVSQLNGEFKIKSQDMLHLWAKTKEQETLFENVIYTWIPREKNKKADRLCNMALDDQKLAVFQSEVDDSKKEKEKKINTKSISKEAREPIIREQKEDISRGSVFVERDVTGESLETHESTESTESPESLESDLIKSEPDQEDPCEDDIL